MRNRNHRTLTKFLPQQPLHLPRCLLVNTRRRLVHDHNGAASQNRAGETHKLTLAVAEVAPAGLDNGGERPGLSAYQGASGFRGRGNARKDGFCGFCAIGLCWIEVVAQGAGEEGRFLR